MLSQIIRFTLRPNLTISAKEFLKLRQSASAAGAAAQYYGYTSDVTGAALPRKRHEICWAISMCAGSHSIYSISESTHILTRDDPVQIGLLQVTEARL